MMYECLRDVFDTVVVKRLVAADTKVGKSHQHEIGGLPKAGFSC